MAIAIGAGGEGSAVAVACPAVGKGGRRLHPVPSQKSSCRRGDVCGIPRGSPLVLQRQALLRTQ